MFMYMYIYILTRVWLCEDLGLIGLTPRVKGKGVRVTGLTPNPVTSSGGDPRAWRPCPSHW